MSFRRPKGGEIFTLHPAIPNPPRQKPLPGFSKMLHAVQHDTDKHLFERPHIYFRLSLYPHLHLRQVQVLPALLEIPSRPNTNSCPARTLPGSLSQSFKHPD